MTLPFADLTQFSELVDLIYQGATDPLQWGAILAAVAVYVEAPKAILFTPLTPPPAGGLLIDHGIPPSFLENWPRFIEHDIWTQAAIKAGLFDEEGAVAPSEQLVPHEEFVRSKIYVELLSRCDIGRMLGATIFGMKSTEHPPTSMSYFCGANDAPFSEEQCQRAGLVIPHISRALGVLQRLRDADLKVAANRAALDRLSAGILLIGEDEEVLFANKRAMRILGNEDGLRLRTRVGRKKGDIVVAADSAAQRALHSALREAVTPDLMATAHFSRSVSVPRLSGKTPYRLHFSSLAQDNEFGTGKEAPRAIVFLSDAEQPLEVDTDWLTATYSLTPAELRVAVLLAEGTTLEEMSGILSVTVNTLRTQLKQIYAKTGVNHRAALVRLLLSLSHPS